MSFYLFLLDNLVSFFSRLPSFLHHFSWLLLFHQSLPFRLSFFPFFFLPAQTNTTSYYIACLYNVFVFPRCDIIMLILFFLCCVALLFLSSFTKCRFRVYGILCGSRLCVFRFYVVHVIFCFTFCHPSESRRVLVRERAREFVGVQHALLVLSQWRQTSCYCWLWTASPMSQFCFIRIGNRLP